MTIKVCNLNIKVSVFKIRNVIDLVRGQRVSEAIRVLRYCEKKNISIIITKLINSGLSLANRSNKYDLDKLKIKSIYADQGATAKRIQARAQGRAYRIKKQSSKITLVLSE